MHPFAGMCLFCTVMKALKSLPQCRTHNFSRDAWLQATVNCYTACIKHLYFTVLYMMCWKSPMETHARALGYGGQPTTIFG